MFRGVLAVANGNHIHHVVPDECRGSVKAYQVHRNQLWGAIEGHAWVIVYKVIDSVRGLIAADIRCIIFASVVESVRKSEFTEKVAIGCGRERLVGVRAETHSAISTKQEGASHCFIGDDVYTYRKRRGRSTVAVKRNGYSDPVGLC